MVQTDISQLARECSNWREQLHSLRDEFHQHQSTLQNAVKTQLTKDQQTELEHFQNQLHIQLINIHDLKQAVKAHDRQLHYEVTDGGINEATASHHEDLYNQYQSLDSTLGELRSEFSNFVTNLSSNN